jgi:replicative DNA helicase
LFISTELEIDELQTMAMAFITGINENEFLTGEFDFAYYDRIKYGAEVLSRAPLKIEVLPNFKIKDIENMIKRYVRQGYRYIFFDYIHTSLGILEEIGQRIHGVSMREDSVLFLLGSRLKEMAVQFGIHITSSTQLNGD